MTLYQITENAIEINGVAFSLTEQQATDLTKSLDQLSKRIDRVKEKKVNIIGWEVEERYSSFLLTNHEGVIVLEFRTGEQGDQKNGAELCKQIRRILDTARLWERLN